MSVITIKQLLEAGVHFGHHTRRWNPKMAEYIFTERNGIYIIDLQKTVKEIRRSIHVCQRFGCRKRQSSFLSEQRNRLQTPFVTKHFVAACTMLTYVGPAVCWQTLKRFKRVLHVWTISKKMREDGTFDLLPKKEAAALTKRNCRSWKIWAVLKIWRDFRPLYLLLTPKRKKCRIGSKKLGIPVIAIVDTNCDPDDADYIIPGNDDAIRAIKLVASTLADAVIEGKQGEQLADAEEPVMPRRKTTKLQQNKIINYINFGGMLTWRFQQKM